MTVLQPQVKPRYRHVRSGLDNAVKQAEERNLHDMFTVDADCHISEPFKIIADYVDAPYKEIFINEPDDDPFIRSRSEGHVEGKYTLSETHYRTGKRKRTEISYPKQQKPDELIDLYTKRMYDLGIKRSIIFPTPLLALTMDPRPDFEVAVQNAYIDFMLDHFLGKYKEILSPVCVPLNIPSKAVDLIERVAREKGIIGVMVPSMSKEMAGSPSWDPIFEAAQRFGLPLCMHGTNYVGDDGFLKFFRGLDKFVGIHSLSRPVTCAMQVASMIFNGVPERFPKLKIVIIEAGVTWIPWAMERYDSVYLLRKEDCPLLTKMPSDYIRENFYFTSQPLEYAPSSDLEYSFKKFDAENHLLYASDYPHWDFDVPSVIYDLPFLSEDAKRKILGENARKLFKIN
ncbi:MAG: amidohydrolase [Nitrososphaerota archaeon]|jgi:predicted TIM-barrel fold metal-dependent hydrolase|nr:amidohydrolase [Nitrososphaerota archaeon]